MYNWLTNIYRFYRDGFAGMTVGRSLWLLILIKVAVLFLVIKLFFFPDVVADKSDHADMPSGDVVRNEMLKRTPMDN